MELTVNSAHTFTNLEGDYIFYAGYGNTTVTPQPKNPYFTVTPPSYSYNFTSAGNTETANFCLTANGVHRDLEVTVLPIVPARPGFDAVYKIVLNNKGTETQSGTLQFTYDDAVLDVVSATPTLMASTSGLLTWGFDNLAPFQTTKMTLVLNVNSPMETPAVNGDDLLTFSASIVSGTDETPSDNTFELLQTVVNSFDPNDKAVSKVTFDNLDEYLYYTIRFQNTGTFYAENVVLKDILSDKLDVTTLQMVSTSHPYRTSLTNGNKLECFFENINLPASVDNEPQSHGYMTFRIKPKSSVLMNETIENTAEIYFDFNFPIVTNTVASTFGTLGNAKFDPGNFVVYPNPAKNTVTVACDKNSNMKSVAIYNMLGQLVKEVGAGAETNIWTTEISNLESGTYLIEVVSDKGKATKKLMKF